MYFNPRHLYSRLISRVTQLGLKTLQVRINFQQNPVVQREPKVEINQFS